MHHLICYHAKQAKVGLCLKYLSILIVASLTSYSLCSVLQLFPFHIPDLSSGSPLIISGRYHGEFPDSLKASGSLADMSNFTIDLKIQKAKEIPLDRVIFYFVIFGLEMIDTFFKTQKVFVRVWKNILHVIMLFLVLYTISYERYHTIIKFILAVI